MTGHHLTIVYKNAPTDIASNGSLSAFMKKFYPHVIGDNFRRHIDRIKPFYFLDVPNSRQG